MQREIMRAGEKSQQMAYAELHVQVRMELGPPSKPSRGTGDCLALVLVPLGLILMLVHPDPAIAIWALAGCLGPGVIEPDESRPCGDPGRRWRSRAPLARPTAPGREDREGCRASYCAAAASSAATASRVRTTASGLRLIESMPSSTRKRAKSGWSLGA